MSWVESIGTAVPAGTVSQSEAADFICARSPQESRNPTAVARLLRTTHVEIRHSVLIDPARPGTLELFYPPRERGPPSTAERMQRFELEAGVLAVAACQCAFQKSSIAPQQITHLITVSCTGMSAPGIDSQIITSLKLSPAVLRTHIGFMGCHALINALRVGDAFVNADPTATVLICSVELCSLHFAYSSQADRLVSNSIFADGACAILLTQQQTPHALKIVHSASTILTQFADAMGWTIRNAGFEMDLSSEVPELIARTLPEWVTSVLKGLSKVASASGEPATPACAHQLEVADIGGWAVHPGGPRILDAVQHSLHLPPEALQTSREILRTYGNMSSATLGFILQRFQKSEVPAPWVCLAFGPGLAFECLILAKN